MSTIHSIFNRVNTSYTVIGNKQLMEKKENSCSISALLLSRGGRPYRTELYKELINLDICEVLSIEIGAKSHFDLEKEAVENSNLRFLILKDEVSIGEMINIGISECLSELVFVIWDDMVINSKTISYRVFEKISQDSRICTVPLIKTADDEIRPTLMTPLFDKDYLKVVPLENNTSLKTLFPFMYVGIYNRDKFIRLGGYDIDINNSYWQKLDFGLRAYMWGEKIQAHKSFNIVTNKLSSDIEDITPNKDYRLYCLKNLSVSVKKDYGILHFRRFFSYYEKSGSNIVEAFKTFINVRKWVKINKYRFKISAHLITSSWDEE